MLLTSNCRADAEEILSKWIFERIINYSSLWECCSWQVCQGFNVLLEKNWLLRPKIFNCWDLEMCVGIWTEQPERQPTHQACIFDSLIIKLNRIFSTYDPLHLWDINLWARGDFHLPSPALPHRLWPFPGQLQAETWNQQGARAFYLDLRLRPRDPARTDQQQREVREVKRL